MKAGHLKRQCMIGLNVRADQPFSENDWSSSVRVGGGLRCDRGCGSGMHISWISWRMDFECRGLEGAGRCSDHGGALLHLLHCSYRPDRWNHRGLQSLNQPFVIVHAVRQLTGWRIGTGERDHPARRFFTLAADFKSRNSGDL